jgi:hypothetical protein
MFRGAVSDASGAFVIDNVSPGSYIIRATKTGFGHDVADVTVGDDGTSTLELKLAASEGITLNLVDVRTRAPINGSAYVVDQQGRVVNDLGFSETPGPVRVAAAPGQYRATVYARGYASRTITVTAPGEQTVFMSPGGTLVVRSKASEPRRGRLLDASGQPLSQRNQYFPIDAAPGFATVPAIFPGIYTLQVVDDNNSVLATVPGITISEGGTTNVEI